MADEDALKHDIAVLNIDLSTSVTIEDENGESKTIQADNIDLMSDAEFVEEYPTITVPRKAYLSGEYELQCPFTNSKNIYRISDRIFASFETDEPFMVVFEDEIDKS
jgi:hypothetical protein